MTIILALKRIVSYTIKKRNSINLNLKIRRILKNIRKQSEIWEPSSNEKKGHRKLWGDFDNHVNNLWLKVYGTISGVKSIYYIPETIYYSEVEPRLNYKPYSKALTDKNHYHKILNEKLLPGILLRNIKGVFYDRNFEIISDEKLQKIILELGNNKYVIKPTSDTGGGKGVRIFEIDRNNFKVFPTTSEIPNIDSLLNVYQRDFIIQEFVNQHEFFSSLNKSSVNTVRICTYRSYSDNREYILHRILRIGRNGSVVDNQSAGGIAINIGKNKKLGSFGIDKEGNKYSSINGIPFSTIGEVPFLEEICVIAKEVASKFLYSRLLGLDFSVDKDGAILLIEVNDLNNEINFYQMTDGPLFGKFTEEVIKYCLHEPKSFMFDFNL